MYELAAPRLSSLALLLVMGVLGGCVSDPSITACDGTNFDEVTLRPGCSALCAEEPCKVYFQMPPGTGTCMVWEGALEIGGFPAGKTVFLGTFWRGWHEFTVEGSSMPPARVHILGSE